MNKTSQNEQKATSENDIKEIGHKGNMEFDKKLIRTFLRLFALESIALLLICMIGAYTLFSKFMPENNGVVIVNSLILSLFIVYSIKFFQYYGD